MANKTMTASADIEMMTDGQIDNAVDKFRAAMRKHRYEISSDVAQQVLGADNFGMEMFQHFRARANMLSDIIVRHVVVVGSRTSQQALDATGRKQYTDSDVVAAMPKGAGGEIEVHFFKLDRYISDNDLEDEYALRGLKPADPYSLAAVNEADPTFADEYPNGTHWKDNKGKWCFAAFHRWHGERELSVNRNDNDWNDHWWFAGVRNSLYFSSARAEEFLLVLSLSKDLPLPPAEHLACVIYFCRKCNILFIPQRFCFP